jgi:hypothetical protein
MDWSSVFEETYPEAGASKSGIRRFVASIARPLTRAELNAINHGQQNPYPESDPLSATWRRFDPSKWTIPNRPLPVSYLDMLAWSDGGEFRTAKRWFQFFPTLDLDHGVRAMLLAYHLPEYMPGALPFAFNGSGVFYLFDMRQPANQGEYPIVCSHSGNLGWNQDQCTRLAETFEAACRAV